MDITKPALFLRKAIKKVDVMGYTIHYTQYPVFRYCWTMNGNDPFRFGPVLSVVREPPEYVIVRRLAAVLREKVC